MKHQATKSPSDQLLAAEWNAEHVLTSGLDASKPSSGLAVGQLYWATDTKTLYKAISATEWEELLRGETVSRLAQLSEKSHANLTGVTASQHHSKTTSGEINLADLAEKAHGNLTGIGPSDHHAKTTAASEITSGVFSWDRIGLKVKPSATIKNSNDSSKFTNSTTYVELKEIKINDPIEGCRIWFTISTPNATYWAYGKIYKNGSPIGTERSTNSVVGEEFSEDFASIDLQPNDLLQIYGKCDPSGQVTTNKFRIGYEIDPTSVTKSTTNQDP